LVQTGEEAGELAFEPLRWRSWFRLWKRAF